MVVICQITNRCRTEYKIIFMWLQFLSLIPFLSYFFCILFCLWIRSFTILFKCLFSLLSVQNLSVFFENRRSILLNKKCHSLKSKIYDYFYFDSEQIKLCTFYWNTIFTLKILFAIALYRVLKFSEHCWSKIIFKFQDQDYRWFRNNQTMNNTLQCFTKHLTIINESLLRVGAQQRSVLYSEVFI